MSIVKSLEKSNTKIRKIARNRDTMTNIENFNKNANEKNPKHANRIWNFLKFIRKQKDEKRAQRFTPLKKKKWRTYADYGRKPKKMGRTGRRHVPH